MLSSRTFCNDKKCTSQYLGYPISQPLTTCEPGNIYSFKILNNLKFKVKQHDSRIFKSYNLLISHIFIPKYILCCAQSCPTLCNSKDCSLSGSSVLGIFFFFSRQEYWSSLYFLFQGIFSTQGLNSHLSCLLLRRQIAYHCTTWEVPKYSQNFK